MKCVHLRWLGIWNKHIRLTLPVSILYLTFQYCYSVLFYRKFMQVSDSTGKYKTVTNTWDASVIPALHKSSSQHENAHSPPASIIARHDSSIWRQSATHDLASTSFIKAPDLISWWYLPQVLFSLVHVTTTCSFSHIDCGYGRPSSGPLHL